MLPADGAHRLVTLLTQALDDCAQQKQKLQQNVMRCQTLLKDWNSEAPENLTLEESKNDQQESKPSVKDLEELELLNKALEKAWRIRTKFQPQPLSGLTETTQGAKGNPVTGTSLNQQAGLSKKRASQTVQVSSVSQKPMSSKKPTAFMLKAPYKTDPAMKRPQAKLSTGLCSKASKVSGGTRTPKAVASPKAKPPGKRTQGPSGKACAEEQPGRQPSYSKTPDSAKSGPSSGNSTGGGDFAGADSLLAKVQCDRPIATVELGTAQIHVGGDPLGTNMMTQTFTLQEKGSSLELPLPYRRAFSKYTRGVHRASLKIVVFLSSNIVLPANLSHTRSGEGNCRMNSSKASGQFFSPSTAFSPAEVRRELLHICEVCSLVRQYMEFETQASLGENLSCKRQYESLLTLEGLQSTVKEYLDKVHQLKEAMESYSKLLPADTACMEECASLGRQRCWDVETVKPPPLLVYSSFKELREMEALKLNVGRLKQQLEIQKAMEAELLPLLEPGHSQEGSEALLYRAIYTLLCEGGEAFPVLVKDEELSN